MKYPQTITTVQSKALRTAVVIAAAGFILAGCTDMADQAKNTPLTQSKFFKDGNSSRQIPEGTVARGHVRDDEHLYTGKLNGKLTDIFPFEVTDDGMKRGQDRYQTFCAPCHGAIGDGTGMIVQRGFPKPPSFHADSIRARPAGHYYDVITNGFGRMYSYAHSVPVDDRWKIVAYIRALQMSQHVRIEDLPKEDQNKITGSPQ